MDKYTRRLELGDSDYHHNLTSKKLVRRSKRIVSNVQRVLIVFGLTILLCTGLLYLGKLLWYMYQVTPVGSYYVERYLEETRAINQILNRNFLLFSFHISLYALALSMIIGVISRFSHIQKYLYRPLGVIGRLLFWAMPLTLIVGYLFQGEFSDDIWHMAFIYASVPTLCLYSCCFDLSQSMIPEVGDVIKFLVELKNRKRKISHNEIEGEI